MMITNFDKVTVLKVADKNDAILV